jgi:hypothetical protein
MMWPLSPRVRLASGRISAEDATRQMRTAREILRRFDRQCGVILADEVGMGKTFVALAVAVSVIEATAGERPVVVMIPPSVQDKWPRDWETFREICLTDGQEIRATRESINGGAAFLKLLDDPESRQNHLIFLTHGALTNSLRDPFVRLALVRQAFLHRTRLKKQRGAFPQSAWEILGERRLQDAGLVSDLLHSPPRQWRTAYRRATGVDLVDDPVPEAVMVALGGMNLSPLAERLEMVPLRESKHRTERIREVRSELLDALNDLWRSCLHRIDIHLPLLVLDEAHHLKNPGTVISSLFATPEAEDEAELLQGGPLAQVFDRMLFLTATPFQLGHHELTEVLRRFEGVRWPDRQARPRYHQSVDDLERRLNSAQTAALRLDRAWGRLRPADLPAEDLWWRDREGRPAALVAALNLAEDAEKRIKSAEEALRPWVIRHTRLDREGRRSVQCGRAIAGGDGHRGLSVSEATVLPFLLAARAQAIVSAEDERYRTRSRALFAEGLASSFEAYRDTRSRRRTETIDDVSGSGTEPLSKQAEWYLRHIDRALPADPATVYSQHPKIAATVQRATELWRVGEKVLVFCFYRATGRALRNHISRAIENWMLEEAAGKLGLAADDAEGVRRELELLSERFFDPDAPITRVARQSIGEIFDSEPGLGDEDGLRAAAIALRFLRTPSFLVRYMDLGAGDPSQAFDEAFRSRDQSGRSLEDKVRSFARFAATRVEAERSHLLEALEDLQTGSIFGVAPSSLEQGEQAERQERLMPNVRLANGEVERATRRRLMVGFNTPFFPEVLIASSVMAEGVDLHLDCRHVIHHDLDWNPSVLEQRTGRIDRLGSKAELTRQPIVVYEPFLEGTQDEKQFRVVKDRERWFDVVMGERLQLDEWSTDQMAERVPFPAELASRLTMRLEVR